MNLLKKENWWIWLLLAIFTFGTSNLVLGALLNVYEKDSWYTKPSSWVLGFLLFIFPMFIMMGVLYLEITTQASAKLNVPFKEIYLSPYVWLFCLGLPFFGWIFFLVMSIYVVVWPIVMLYRGEGEKYIR